MVGGQGERLVVSAPIIIERDIVDYVNVIVKLVDLKREETTDWRGKTKTKETTDLSRDDGHEVQRHGKCRRWETHVGGEKLRLFLLHHLVIYITTIHPDRDSIDVSLVASSQSLRVEPVNDSTGPI